MFFNFDPFAERAPTPPARTRGLATCSTGRWVGPHRLGLVRQWGGRHPPHRDQSRPPPRANWLTAVPHTRWFVVLGYLLRAKLLGTVQTDQDKVISVEKMSRADHGMITTAPNSLHRRSSCTFSATSADDPRYRQVSQITGVL
jgi:hypothetical protein